MRVFYYEILDSTMNKAQELIDSGHKNFFVMANKQTNGRGRLGRAWHSADGNLYCTMVVENSAVNLNAYLSFCFGVALFDVLQEYDKILLNHPNLCLKWPNDILFHHQKVAGILCQIHKNCVLIGFGCNFVANDWGGFLPIKPDFQELFAKLARKFQYYYEILQKFGFVGIKHHWLSRAMEINTPIRTTIGTEKQQGFFMGVDDTGGLLFAQNNIIKTIIVGDIAVS